MSHPPLPHVRRDQPTGTVTIRLADVPLDQRLKALQQLIRHTKTDEDALELYLVAIDPGEKGGRIAA